MLHSYSIKVLVDVRTLPGSQKHPQFNNASLKNTLPEKGIKYLHVKKLGGLRKAKVGLRNRAWRNPMFRGYADYMETNDFQRSRRGVTQDCTNPGNYNNVRRTALVALSSLFDCGLPQGSGG